jgi:hypothetical protein
MTTARAKKTVMMPLRTDSASAPVTEPKKLSNGRSSMKRANKATNRTARRALLKRFALIGTIILAGRRVAFGLRRRARCWPGSRLALTSASLALGDIAAVRRRPNLLQLLTSAATMSGTATKATHAKNRPSPRARTSAAMPKQSALTASKTREATIKRRTFPKR